MRGGLIEYGGLALGGELGSDGGHHRSVVRLDLFLSEGGRRSFYRCDRSCRLFCGRGLEDLRVWFRLGGLVGGM